MEEKKKTEWAAQQRASLNLQDSVENSFREKLVIQVHTVNTVEQLQREACHKGTWVNTVEQLQREAGHPGT